MIEHLQKALTFMLKHEKCSEKSHIRQIIVINGHIYIIAFKTKNPLSDLMSSFNAKICLANDFVSSLFDIFYTYSI